MKTLQVVGAISLVSGLFLLAFQPIKLALISSISISPSEPETNTRYYVYVTAKCPSWASNGCTLKAKLLDDNYQWIKTFEDYCVLPAGKTDTCEFSDIAPSEAGYYIIEAELGKGYCPPGTSCLYTIETKYKRFHVKASVSCTDECSYSGETKYYCSGNDVYKKVCGYYDSDPCLDWSSGEFVKDCDNQDGWYCKDKYTREYRNYYCSGGSCTYTVTKTEKCPEGYVCQNGKCVSTGPKACSSGDISVTITEISPNKDTYRPGEEVTVKVKVKNNRNYPVKTLVEVGAVPKGTWGLTIPLATVRYGDCCEGQENIEDAWVTLNANEETTLEFKIKLPYKGIKDLCYDNEYWKGEGEYVIYAVAVKDCYPNNDKCSDVDKKYITIKEVGKLKGWAIDINIAAGTALLVAGILLLLLA